MYDFLLVVQTIVVLLLIGIILIQRSDSDGFGTGSGGGGNQFMTGRASANLLTRATAILATIFIVLSLVLAKLSSGGSSSIVDIVEQPGVPVEAPASAPLVDADAPSTGKPAAPVSAPKPE